MRWDYGTIYKKIRKSKHISQEEVCQGYISRSHLSRIESNQVMPSFELMEHSRLAYISKNFDIYAILTTTPIEKKLSYWQKIIMPTNQMINYWN